MFNITGNYLFISRGHAISTDKDVLEALAGQDEVQRVYSAQLVLREGEIRVLESPTRYEGHAGKEYRLWQKIYELF